MGNIFAVTISAGLDYFAGSITAMIWEWIFHPYDPTRGRLMNTIEGLIQLGAICSTAPYVLSLITPAEINKEVSLGLIGLMYFSFLYSPNMRAKLQNAHTMTREALLFIPGGFVTTSKDIDQKLLDEKISIK